MIIFDVISTLFLIFVIFTYYGPARLRRWVAGGETPAGRIQAPESEPESRLEIYQFPARKKGERHKKYCQICRMNFSPVYFSDKDFLALWRGWRVHRSCRDWITGEYARRGINYTSINYTSSPVRISRSENPVPVRIPFPSATAEINGAIWTTRVICRACGGMGTASKAYRAGGPLPPDPISPPAGHTLIPPGRNGFHYYWRCPQPDGTSMMAVPQPVQSWDLDKTVLGPHGHVLPPAQAEDLWTGLRKMPLHEGGFCTACRLAMTRERPGGVTNGGEGVYHKDCYKAALRANPKPEPPFMSPACRVCK